VSQLHVESVVQKLRYEILSAKECPLHVSGIADLERTSSKEPFISKEAYIFTEDPYIFPCRGQVLQI